MFALCFIAHTLSAERVIAVQPEPSGSASLLFLFRVPEAQRALVDAGWLDTALLDVELSVDGQPAKCVQRWEASAVLWECAAGVHWQLLVGSHMPTAMAFAAAARAFGAADASPQPLERSVRMLEWVALP